MFYNLKTPRYPLKLLISQHMLAKTRRFCVHKVIPLKLEILMPGSVTIGHIRA